MTFPTDDILLGPRSWGKRPATEGIIWHTTEGADTSRASAVSTAKWQAERTATGGWAHPGSYNFIIYDGGVLLTVPYLEASGGINPLSAAWAPERYPYLKSALSAAAYSNPTGYHLQVAFSGKTAEFAAGRIPQNMIDTAARLTIWVEDSAWGADNQIFSGHYNWQSNRSDPSAVVLQRILDKVVEFRKPAPVPAPTPPPPPPPPSPAPTDYKALYEATLKELASVNANLNSVSKQLASTESARDKAQDAYSAELQRAEALQRKIDSARIGIIWG